MSEIDPDIDGYPDFEAEKQRSAGIVRDIAYEAIQHSIERGISNVIVTWVDTEGAWDGHALALCHPERDSVSMRYFHVNRDRGNLIQRSRLDLDISAINAADDQDDLQVLIEESCREFDEKSLLYTHAMLGKIACLEPHSDPLPTDSIVMRVLIEEKLPELSKLFPNKNREKLPYVSDEFLNAARNLMKIQGLEEGKNDIFLKKIFGRETYIIHLQFINGKLHYGIFVQGKDEKWITGHHHYVEDDPYVIGVGQEWDPAKLIRTVQRGPEISRATFDIYFKEADDAEDEDYRKRLQENTISIKRQTSEEPQD